MAEDMTPERQAKDDREAAIAGFRERETVTASKPKPVLRLLLSLVLFALIGALIWVVYGLASNSFAFLGNCGPSDLIGQSGHLVGGAAASAPTAAAIGGVLWAVAGAAVWRLRQTAGVALIFIVLYLGALLILSLVVSPAIWGARHCVIS